MKVTNDGGLVVCSSSDLDVAMDRDLLSEHRNGHLDGTLQRLNLWSIDVAYARLTLRVVRVESRWGAERMSGGVELHTRNESGDGGDGGGGGVGVAVSGASC